MTTQAPRQDSVEVVLRNVTELAQRQQARELGSSLARQMFRLFKVAQFHALENMTVLQQLDQTVEALEAFGKQTGEPLSLLFTKSTVFVNGQLLKATRAEYESALELSRMVQSLGVTQLTIQTDANRSDLKALARLFQPGSGAKAVRGVIEPSPRVRLRYVHAARLDENDNELSPEDQILRTYTTTVVVMRRVWDNLLAGRYQLPNQAKRLAQRLVVLSEGDTPAFLGVTGMRNLNHDEAGRAVNRAILAVSMGRQLTADLATLSRIAMSALFFGVATPLVTGMVGKAGQVVVPHMTDDVRKRLPAATAVVLTALGQLREASMVRTVIAFESQWLRHHDALGPLYEGEQRPMVAARIVATAHRFNELMEPDLAAQRAPSVDDAISTLRSEAREALDQAMLVLLVGALGVFPRGAPVELTTGEKAVVLATPDNPVHYTRPSVRLVYDAQGQPLRAKIVLDLRQDPVRQVARVIADPDDVLRQACAAASPSAAPPPRAPAPESVPPAPAAEPGPAHSVSPLPATVRPRAGSERPPSMPPRSSSAPGPIRSAPPPSMRHAAVEMVEAPASRHDPRSDDYVPDASDSRVSARSTRSLRAAAPVTSSLRPRMASTPALEEPEEPTSDPTPLSVSWRERAASLHPTSESPPPRRFSGTHTPSATGGLEKTPLSHLLLYILDHQLEGTLILTVPGPEEIEHAVYFERGQPRKAVVDAWTTSLGSSLVARGLLDQSVLESDSITHPPTHEPTLERELLELGLVRSEQLAEARTEQLYERLTFLFSLPPSTRFAFCAGVDLLKPEWGNVPGRASARAALARGLREHPEHAAMNRVLSQSAGEPLSMCEGADAFDFELTEEEIAVVVAIANAAPSLGDLLASGHDPAVVRRVVYELLLARCAAPLS